MSVNYSFSTNDSFLSPLSSNNSFLDPSCSILDPHTYIALAFTNVLLLFPLSVFVLKLGFQQWKPKCSVSSAAAVSFSDFFAYNIAVLELIGVLGYIISICSYYANLPAMGLLGLVTSAFPWFGQMFFPMLTSVERYLAVVHPITYLRLKQARGIRIRNISSGVVWLHCFAGVGFLFLILKNPQYIFILNASVTFFLFVAVSFFSLSVLCVLIRPRPGEAGGKKVRVDRSKRKACQTIIIITGVLLLRFGGNMVCYTLTIVPTVSLGVYCMALMVPGWFSLPSSLVLPLLLLHRAGKLPGCKHNSKSGGEM